MENNELMTFLQGMQEEMRSEFHKLNRRVDVLERESNSTNLQVKTLSLASKMFEADLYKLRQNTEESFATLTTSVTKIETDVEILKDDNEIIKEGLEEVRSTANIKNYQKKFFKKHIKQIKKYADKNIRVIYQHKFSLLNSYYTEVIL